MNLLIILTLNLQNGLRITLVVPVGCRRRLFMIVIPRTKLLIVPQKLIGVILIVTLEIMFIIQRKKFLLKF